MHTFIKRALVGTLLAGGITLLGATVANATETTGEDGLLSGNQALIDVSAPVSIVDNAVSVIGDSTVVGAPPAPVTAPAPAAAGRGAHHERGRRHRVRQPGDRERRCSGHRHGQCRVGHR